MIAKVGQSRSRSYKVLHEVLHTRIYGVSKLKGRVNNYFKEEMERIRLQDQLLLLYLSHFN